MDWTAILVAALGGGVVAKLADAFFHWLEQRNETTIAAARVRLETQELDIEADKVKIEEKHVDAAAAEKIAAAFTQLVTELRMQQQVQHQEHAECRQLLAAQAQEIERLREQVTGLQAELYRLTGRHGGG